MSTVIQHVKQAVVGRNHQLVFCECRRCGTTVTETDDRCPSCDSSEIARYQLA